MSKQDKKAGNETRIYVVDGDGSGAAGTPRLVRARSQAQAVSYVVRGKYTAKVATQTDLVALCSTGSKVEEATDE